MDGYWSDIDAPVRPMLRGRRAADAVVIGGGLSGLTIALWLQRAGVRVILLEAERIAGGASSRCAGMLSLMNGLNYARLEKRSGVAAVSAYAQTQQSALEAIRELCRSEGFDSGLQDSDAQLISDEKECERLLADEADAMQRAGLSAAAAKPTQCPLPASGSLLLRDMAIMNPMRYIASLVKCAESLGLKLYESSRVNAVETNLVYTERGSVLAPYIVIATGYPIVNIPGYYFLKLRQRRSCLIPIGSAEFDGMFFDMRGGFALRQAQMGGLFRMDTGLAGSTSISDVRGKFMARYAPGLGSERPKHVYAGYETFSPDGLPYIGAYSKKTPNLFVASGYNHNGIIGSMVAAQAISAAVLGLNMESYGIYSGFRKSGADGARAALAIAGKFIGSQLHLHAPRCPHLGCKLKYNRDSRIWECPCHGSRFDDIGHVLSAPAVKNAEIGRK